MPTTASSSTAAAATTSPSRPPARGGCSSSTIGFGSVAGACVTVGARRAIAGLDGPRSSASTRSSSAIISRRSA